MKLPWLCVDLDERTIVKAHRSTLISRMIRAGLRVTECRYRVVAAGIDSKNRIIAIATNRPKYRIRGQHAEERIIHCSPQTLTRILILRVNAKGVLLPIEPCQECVKLAKRRGVIIESVDRVGGSASGSLVRERRQKNDD